MILFDGLPVTTETEESSCFSLRSAFFLFRLFSSLSATIFIVSKLKSVHTVVYIQNNRIFYAVTVKKEIKKIYAASSLWFWYFMLKL